MDLWSMIRRRFIILTTLVATSTVYSFDNFKSYEELKFKNMVKQKSEYTCGLATLSITLNEFYGYKLEEEEMIDSYLEEIIERESAVSFADLKKISEDNNFMALGFKMNYLALKEISSEGSLPLIIHLSSIDSYKDIGHFVVLIGIYKDYLIIKDPAYGNYVEKKESFMDRWSGNVLLVRPLKGEENKPKLQEAKSILKSYFTLYSKKIERIFYYEKFY